MDALQTIGLWPFIGLCAGVGAFTWVVTRAVLPAKPCGSGLLNHPAYANWAANKGEYTHFEAGKRRLVHVSRTSIGWNLRNGNQDFPTCVVIDENGEKHEFHEVFLHDGGTQLVFDPDGDTAKVYMVTYGRISCRKAGRFNESPSNPFDPRAQETAQLKLDLDTVKRQRDKAELELKRLQQKYYDDLHVAEVGKGDASRIIQGLRDDNRALNEQLAKKDDAYDLLTVSDDINIPGQTKRVRKTRDVKIGHGCGSYYDTEVYYDDDPLVEGEEGFIDEEKQVRYCRVSKKMPAIVIQPIPLKEGDQGYRDPNEVPC